VTLTKNTTLDGGGTVILGDSLNTEIVGKASGVMLTNVNDTIRGAGDIGGGLMALVNEAGGTIDADRNLRLTIDTGANTVINAGIIEATKSGRVTIAGAVGNTGTLIATGNKLTVMGVVTGGGVVQIGGGATADFAAAFTEKVIFTGPGLLELAKSRAYAGIVSGFSKSGTTAFDLQDIALIAGTTKATYSGGAKSGTLTVTDGTRTAHIALKGDYRTSAFVASSDGMGGTMIVDPIPGSAASAASASPQAFIAAMAGWGGSAGAMIQAGETWPVHPPILSRPRARVA
jgi:hypothetical protein